MTLITISFDLKGITYYALARKKKSGALSGYAITIMHGPLEQQFFGHHYIPVEAGKLVYDLAPHTEIGHLKCAITQSLDRYLQQAQLAELSLCCC